MIENKQVEWAKESGDHGEVLKEIARGVSEGKSIMEIASSLPDEVMASISGADQTDDEMRENLPAFIGTLCYQVGYAVGLMLQKKDEAGEPEPEPAA